MPASISESPRRRSPILQRDCRAGRSWCRSPEEPRRRASAVLRGGATAVRAPFRASCWTPAAEYRTDPAVRNWTTAIRHSAGHSLVENPGERAYAHSTSFVGEAAVIRSTFRAAWRQLRQDIGYAVAFVVTLGLGIGASTAIFSAVEGVLIRPLPYPHADRIVYVQQPLQRTGDENTHFSFVEAGDYRTQTRTLEEVVEYGDWQFNVVGL